MLHDYDGQCFPSPTDGSSSLLQLYIGLVNGRGNTLCFNIVSFIVQNKSTIFMWLCSVALLIYIYFFSLNNFYTHFHIFSAPELKAQASFSDRLSPVQLSNFFFHIFILSRTPLTMSTKHGTGHPWSNEIVKNPFLLNYNR